MDMMSSTSSQQLMSDFNTSIISNAEQKRRCNIQLGFERLQDIVPTLKEGENGKASIAMMLQKTVDYITDMRTMKDQRTSELDAYKDEIENLSRQISHSLSTLSLFVPSNSTTIVMTVDTPR